MGIDDGLPRISSASPAEWEPWLEGSHAVCGRWDAPYEGRRRSTVPDDLRRELDARPGARACFDELDSQNRRQAARLDDDANEDTIEELAAKHFAA